MENSFKILNNKPEGASIFSKLEKTIKMEGMFEKGLPVKYLPKILFLTFVMILYIGNSHHAEKMIRKIDKLEVQVEDLRADFTTLKADYMYARLQSEVSKKTKKLGLEESSEPPSKIIIKDP